MKLKILTEKLIGETLASRIYNENGILLLSPGVRIEAKHLFLLKNIGINTLYIADEHNDMTLQYVLEPTIRIQLMNRLKNEFGFIEKTQKIHEVEVADILRILIENVNLSENALLLNDVGQSDDRMKLVVHSINVAILSIIVGTSKNLDTTRLLNLGLGALLHDIGKLLISNETHPIEGYIIVKKNHYILPTAQISILQHHEHIDGSGYPNGISTKKIHEYSKIVAICNEYVNSISLDEGYLPYEIIERISAQTLNYYDADIFRDFSKTIYCYPNGSEVVLSNGTKGLVITQNRGVPTRPVVWISENQKVNLVEDLTVFIEQVIL